VGMQDRVGKIIDDKPRVFDMCSTCGSEVEFVCTYDGTFLDDFMKDKDVSGSYTCGSCGTKSHSDFIPRSWIHNLFN